MNIVTIKFEDDSRTEYYNAEDFELKPNLTVIAQTKQGTRFGTVDKINLPLPPHTNPNKLPQIVRISTKKDYHQYKKNEKDAKEAYEKCRELVKENELPMNVISARYTFDRDKLIFEFVSDNRVDFRQLAKELAYYYRTRIELRQIGIRDKAKQISGYGPCGQKLCCARFLKDLNAVSINMAKNQNIALNPSKINGVCGRLMCCLKYEDSCYKMCRQGMLKIGDKVQTEHGEGTIISLDILRQKYKVNVPEHGIVEIDKK